MKKYIIKKVKNISQESLQHKHIKFILARKLTSNTTEGVPAPGSLEEDLNLNSGRFFISSNASQKEKIPFLHSKKWSCLSASSLESIEEDQILERKKIEKKWEVGTLSGCMKSKDSLLSVGMSQANPKRISAFIKKLIQRVAVSDEQIKERYHQLIQFNQCR